MPYQLNYAGNNTTLKRRIAPFPLPTNFTQDLRVDVTFIHANSGTWQAYLNTPDTVATNNTFFLVASSPSDPIYFYSGGAQLSSGVTAVNGQEYTVSVTVSTSKVVGLSVNGGAYVTRSYPNLNAALLGQLLFGATTNSDGSIYRDTFIGQLRRVETWVGGSKTGDYTNTTGTGTTLVNSIGGATATQAGNWPADNSEWVFYSSGSYSLSADGGTFAYSGAAASTLLNRRLSANGGNFNYSGASSALRLNRLLTANGSTFSYAGASADLLLNRQLNADGASFTYSGAAATLTYTQITGFVLNADGGAFSTAGGDVEFIYVQNLPEANANDFTASAIVDISFSFESRISPTVSFSAMISSTFKFNGSLN